MKIFLGTLIGLIVTYITMGLLGKLGYYFYPIPFEIDPKDPEGLKEKIHLIPVATYLTIVIANGLGLFTGLLVARAIDNKTAYSVNILAGFMFICSLVNLIMSPHPLWFGITNVVIIGLIGVVFIIRARRLSKVQS